MEITSGCTHRFSDGCDEGRAEVEFRRQRGDAEPEWCHDTRDRAVSEHVDLVTAGLENQRGRDERLEVTPGARRCQYEDPARGTTIAGTVTRSDPGVHQSVAQQVRSPAGQRAEQEFPTLQEVRRSRGASDFS